MPQPGHAQLAAIVARAMPGAQLAQSAERGDGRFTLTLADGSLLDAQTYAEPAAAQRAVAALQLLRGEVDLAVPQLRALDPQGSTGVAYTLADPLPGEPLLRVLPQLNDDACYRLGRQLGEIVYRIHRMAAGRYGTLTNTRNAAADERTYVLQRLDAELPRAVAARRLSAVDAAVVRGRFDRRFLPVGSTPALICGAITPTSVLVQRVGSGWQIGGLVRWDAALGWCPAWEHVTFSHAFGDAALFSLRVGYGNAYDELTKRAYEQVREHALRPYSALLTVDHLLSRATTDLARRQRLLLSLTAIMDQEYAPPDDMNLATTA